MNKKKLAIIAFLFLSFLFFFSLFTKINKTKTKIEEKLSLPTPTPIVSFEATPSAYATDSAVLKIEKEAENLEKELETIDLEESSLQPPVIDLRVEY